VRKEEKEKRKGDMFVALESAEREREREERCMHACTELKYEREIKQQDACMHTR